MALSPSPGLWATCSQALETASVSMADPLVQQQEANWVPLLGSGLYRAL